MLPRDLCSYFRWQSNLLKVLLHSANSRSLCHVFSSACNFQAANMHTCCHGTGTLRDCGAGLTARAGHRRVCNAPRWSRVSWRPRTAATKHSGTQVVQEETAEEVTQSTVLDKLAGLFLNRAASSLKRGASTCLSCKGKGACDCPACKGGGLLSENQARMNTMRHTVQKLQTVLHVDRAVNNTEWLLTNRCRRCQGKGVIICEQCNGMGMRIPVK